MSPTLLEIVVAIILVIVLWQIGVIIAPGVLRWLGRLGQDVNNATDQALTGDNNPAEQTQEQHSKEHRNGTHR